MKKCPNCHQVYDSDEVFCVADGTVLVVVAENDATRFFVSLEQPTQVTPFPPVNPPVNPAAAATPPKGQYFLVGVLVAIIFAMAAVLFVLRNGSEKDSAGISNRNSMSASFSSPLSQNNETTKSNAAKMPEKTAPKANSNSSGNFAGGNAAETQMPASNYAPVNGFRLTRNFNRTFSGTADNDGVSMRLQRSGASLSGRVFSRRSDTEITVSGSIDNNGYFEMSEYSDIGVMTGSYSGRINPDGTMTGTWTKPDGSKPRSFFLRAN